MHVIICVAYNSMTNISTDLIVKFIYTNLDNCSTNKNLATHVMVKKIVPFVPPPKCS